MPSIVKSNVPKIVYFAGWEEAGDKAPAVSFRWMPGEERTVSDAQLADLRKLEKFVAMESKRQFSVFAAPTNAKVGEVKLPAAADPEVARKMFQLPPS